jgi:uncharacterized MnhB-related membrane protein
MAFSCAWQRRIDLRMADIALAQAAIGALVIAQSYFF